MAWGSDWWWLDLETEVAKSSWITTSRKPDVNLQTNRLSDWFFDSYMFQKISCKECALDSVAEREGKPAVFVRSWGEHVRPNC